MKTNEGWDDMLKAAKAKSGPQPNGGSGVKQGTRYGGSKSKMDAPAPTKGPSVSQLRSLKKDMKKEDVNQVEEAKTPSDSDLHKTLGPTKNMQQGIEALKKKHGMTDDQAKKHIRRLMGMKEEVEQIDELSKSTLGSYVKKAHQHKSFTAADIGRMGYSGNTSGDQYKKVKDKHKNRSIGIDRAVDRMTKEEAEQIDELSKSTLRSYIDKKSDDHESNRNAVADARDALRKHQRNKPSLDAPLKHQFDHSEKKRELERDVNAASRTATRSNVNLLKAKKRLNKEEMATEMDEALVGNQHKLDKNKNGRLDKHDFKKLRGEEKDTVTMNPKIKSTKSSGETNNESVKSADKEAETYTDSKGKTKYRMVAKDKNMKVESKIRTSLKSVLENKQTVGAAVQPMNDSNTISGAGAKKMKKDHEPVIPKGGDEPAQEKDNFDNATAGVNKSPMRPNDNAKGDKNIINPVSDITKKASKKEDDGFKQGGAPKLATSEGFIDKISQIYKNMFK